MKPPHADFSKYSTGDHYPRSPPPPVPQFPDPPSRIYPGWLRGGTLRGVWAFCAPLECSSAGPRERGPVHSGPGHGLVFTEYYVDINEDFQGLGQTVLFTTCIPYSSRGHGAVERHRRSQGASLWMETRKEEHKRTSSTPTEVIWAEGLRSHHTGPIFGQTPDKYMPYQGGLRGCVCGTRDEALRNDVNPKLILSVR